MLLNFTFKCVSHAFNLWMDLIPQAIPAAVHADFTLEMNIG